MNTYILANFGGPRNLKEIRPFLSEILTDQNLVRTSWPRAIHKNFFKCVARVRSNLVKKNYRAIGGCSPIFENTEIIAELLSKKLNAKVLPFHRYLPETHLPFLKKVHSLNCKKIQIFPMFPQFSHFTSGNIEKWLKENLPRNKKIISIKSYAKSPGFAKLFQEKIKKFLDDNNIDEKNLLIIFSAHNIPLKFAQSFDFLYLEECVSSYKKISADFPRAKSIIAYQSLFGMHEGIRPYTIDVAKNIKMYAERRENVLFVPLTFTSDNIETMFEVEHKYLPVIRKKDLNAFRLPAFNTDDAWIDFICKELNSRS